MEKKLKKKIGKKIKNWKFFEKKIGKNKKKSEKIP